MIDIQKLITNPEDFKTTISRRGGDSSLVDKLIEYYSNWKTKQQEVDVLRAKQNSFNKTIVTLNQEEKQAALQEIKALSENLKALELETRELKEAVDKTLKSIPSLVSAKTPTGKNDDDNPEIATWGTKPEFQFEPKPYWELNCYKNHVHQEAGAKAMGARGFYMSSKMAWFQKVLFDYVLDTVMEEGLELMYVPLMLNSEVLTGTGHLPDFDGQQYEVPITEDRNYYLIGSSEPSIMGYFMNESLGDLKTPKLLTCWSSCFRKEAGSYGKDQQGIFRVHQFEKIEMVAICQPEDAEDLFHKFGQIEEKIYSSLGLYFRAVEVCTGDLPAKHFRQVDYEAWFPTQNKFRELGSNGNASDFQNRGLNIKYTTQAGKKEVPWGLNCTAVTFRTGLAILEQFQQADGSVKIPEVLVQRFKDSVLN